MRVALFFFGVAVFGFIGVIATHGGNAPPAVNPTKEEQAVLDYRACDGGMDLDDATRATIQLAQAQSFRAIRRTDVQGKLSIYEIPYKAQNGDARAVKFNYNPATGIVNAENNDGLTVLTLMKAGCR